MPGNQIRPLTSYTEFKNEDFKQSIPARFENVVERYPDHLAVKIQHEEWTYSALNQEANRVARTLLAQNEEKHRPVALLFDQGPDFLSSLLGVTKAGKFYVPLDPSAPVERNLQVLENSKASLLLTNTQNIESSKELAAIVCSVINIDEFNPDIPGDNIHLAISPSSPALIIYTSGSTGTPKGVVHTHRSFLHTMQTHLSCFPMFSEDRLSLFFSPSFSAGARNIFLALFTGASLYPYDIKRDGISGLGDWLKREKISICRMIPTAFRHLVYTFSEKADLPDLRIVHLLGEAIHPADVQQYQDFFPDQCVFSYGYSATETGLVLHNLVDKQTKITGNALPLFDVEDEAEILLLDEDGKMLGVDQVGQIAVKSAYLAQGYWGDPDQTEAAFLPDPEGGDKRIYLTGDMGRRLPDGALLHQGRKDYQVKIRGHRIEVAEIEMALLDLPMVKETVVMPQEDKVDDQQLVAYFVPADESPPTVSALRRELEKTLPSYMIPSSFMAMKHFPLTPNGKVDRRALPAPGSARPELEIAFVPPQNPIEKRVADVWCEVLGLNEVGVDDHFLELGGDSLKAAQVIARVGSKMGVELSIATLFESPTVRELARKIAQLEEREPKLQTQIVSHRVSITHSPPQIMPSIKKYIDLIKLFLKYPFHLDAFMRDSLDRFYPVFRRLARAYRHRIIPRKRLIAVVGSLGKTTTKRALRAAILEKDRYQSSSNYGSRLAENVLRSRPCDRYDVFEVGISGPNGMDWPAIMLNPDIVVVTSIKSDHNRSLKTLEDTRREKVKMVQALSPRGVAVLNGDDPHVAWMATQTQAKVVTYGMSSAHDVWASDLQLHWPEGTSFTLHTNNEARPVRIRLIGEQMIYPILASVAVAMTEGISLDSVIPKLEALAPTPGRMEPIVLENGVTFLDDSFKAPLESIHVALDTFSRIPAKRRIVVMGEVEEPPGSQGPIYRELGARIATCADLLLFVPRKANFQRIRRGASQAGMPRTSILNASNSVEKAIEILRSEMKAGDVVLLKGASAGRYRRILLGVQGKNVNCTVKSCRVKVFFCEDCPLIEVDTRRIHNQHVRRLLRH